MRWRRWRWLAFLALLLAASILFRQLGWGQGGWDAAAQQFSICGQASSNACVIDGDTLALGERRIRLTGYDAPEMDGACEAERRLARVARDELAGWLNLGAFEMSGGAEPPRDRYGRELREVRRSGESLADWMVERGLARSDNSASSWC